MRPWVTTVLSLAACATAPAEAHGHAVPDMYLGLGSWVDRYDAEAWRQPERTVHALARRGVTTIFLQTANYAHRDDLPVARTLGRFLDSAHSEGIRMVAWYAPDLCDLRRDERRSLAAIRFRSSRHHRFDSFGLDIESACVQSPRQRSKRLLLLSSRLRRAVGGGYPLAAIIPSPRGMQLRAERYWPRFPFAALHRYFDAFALMTYFTYRANGAYEVQAFTRQDSAILRQEVGDPEVVIHSIGGEAQRASTSEVRGFTAAVQEANVHGASLYDARTTTPRMWSVLRQAFPEAAFNECVDRLPRRRSQICQ